jgi:hypothetical protein
VFAPVGTTPPAAWSVAIHGSAHRLRHTTNGSLQQWLELKKFYRHKNALYLSMLGMNGLKAATLSRMKNTVMLGLMQPALH